MPICFNSLSFPSHFIFPIFQSFLIQKKKAHNEKRTYRAVFKNKEIGRIVYYPAQQKLVLTNRGVQLSKKILLLGYTSKKNKDFQVGQFGEGLKVGILSLLRDGKTFRMESGEEIWSFVFQLDPLFRENVLTLQIAKKKLLPLKENPGEGFEGHVLKTVIGGLKEEEWDSYLQDYLFLSLFDLIIILLFSPILESLVDALL
jgi:hypothetical protein